MAGVDCGAFVVVDCDAFVVGGPASACLFGVDGCVDFAGDVPSVWRHRPFLWRHPWPTLLGVSP